MVGQASHSDKKGVEALEIFPLQKIDIRGIVLIQADIPSAFIMVNFEPSVTLSSGQKMPMIGLGTWQVLQYHKLLRNVELF